MQDLKINENFITQFKNRTIPKRLYGDEYGKYYYDNGFKEYTNLQPYKNIKIRKRKGKNKLPKGAYVDVPKTINKLKAEKLENEKKNKEEILLTYLTHHVLKEGYIERFSYLGDKYEDLKKRVKKHDALGNVERKQFYEALELKLILEREGLRNKLEQERVGYMGEMYDLGAFNKPAIQNKDEYGDENPKKPGAEEHPNIDDKPVDQYTELMSETGTIQQTDLEYHPKKPNILADIEEKKKGEIVGKELEQVERDNALSEVGLEMEGFDELDNPQDIYAENRKLKRQTESLKDEKDKIVEDLNKLQGKYRTDIKKVKEEYKQKNYNVGEKDLREHIKETYDKMVISLNKYNELGEKKKREEAGKYDDEYTELFASIEKKQKELKKKHHLPPEFKFTELESEGEYPSWSDELKEMHAIPKEYETKEKEKKGKGTTEQQLDVKNIPREFRRVVQGLSLGELVYLIKTALAREHKENLYDIEYIVNDKSDIKLSTYTTNYIIIFLKDAHFRILIIEDVFTFEYFDPYGFMEDNFNRDIKQMEDFALKLNREDEIKLKINEEQWQENGNFPYDFAWCGLYCYIFFYNSVILDEEFEYATQFNQEDKDIITKVEFAYI